MPRKPISLEAKHIHPQLDDARALIGRVLTVPLRGDCPQWLVVGFANARKDGPSFELRHTRTHESHTEVAARVLRWIAEGWVEVV